MEQKGFLKEGEPHPAVQSAKEYISKIPEEVLHSYQEAFSSCAIENNRLAEICSETLRRLLNGEPVSDRYFLGLIWTIRESEIRIKESQGENHGGNHKS